MLMKNKMETLPSLHLFAEGASPGARYNDLDYLKATHAIHSSLAETHLDDKADAPEGTRANKHEVFSDLQGLQRHVCGSSHDEQSGVILFNMPSRENTSINPIMALAKMLSEQGNRVLMLDCNLKNDSSVFGDLSPGIGLEDYIAGNAGLDRILHETGHRNLCYIKSGYCLGNSVKSLMSAKFNALIENLKNQFDYILVNSPPYRESIDTFVLAKFLRPVVVLFRSEHQSSDDDLGDVRDELGVLKLPIMELV